MKKALLLSLTTSFLFSCGGNVYRSNEALDQTFASLSKSSSKSDWIESENNFHATLSRLESEGVDSAAFCEALQSRSVEDQVIILSEVEESSLAANCIEELNQTAKDYLQPFRDKLASKNIKPVKINHKKLYAPVNQYKYFKGNENFIGDKEVILSFDDGPNMDAMKTPALVEVLKKWNVKSMFFMLGQLVERPKGMEYAKLIKSQGHTMATHSRTHAGQKGTFRKGGLAAIQGQVSADVVKSMNDAPEANWSQLLSPQQLEQFIAGGAQATAPEIINNHRNVDQLLGGISPYFRFPGGMSFKALDKILNDSWGLSIWHWNIDSLDYATPNPDQLVKNVISGLEKHRKGMLLFHDIQPQTAIALPEILKYLADNNYTILVPVEK